MSDDVPRRPLGADLEALAQDATSNALSLAQAGPGLGDAATRAAATAEHWAATAAHAARAREHVANTPPDLSAGDMPPDEREAAAALVRELRERVRLHDEFLRELHDTFANAGTATSQRLADRIADHMQLVEEEARQA